MKIGADNISLRLGSVEIPKAYLGDELVHGEEQQKDYWLVSNGNSYLDTGYTANVNSEFEFRFYMNEVKDYGPYIGSCGTMTVLPFYRKYQAGIYANRFGDGLYKISNTALSINTPYAVTAYRGNDNITYNGSSVGTLAAGTEQSSRALYMFAFEGDLGNSAFRLKGGIQYLRIYESGTLVRNFVAKQVNGVAGFYDTITGRFCPSLTSTPFTLAEVTT